MDYNIPSGGRGRGAIQLVASRYRNQANFQSCGLLRLVGDFTCLPHTAQ